MHLAKTKAVAVQIFELNNTRGIQLSTIEKVKSKLMKTVYLYAENEAAEKVAELQDIFAAIYKMEDQVDAATFRGELGLDEVLNYHLRMVDDGSKLVPLADGNGHTVFSRLSASKSQEIPVLAYLDKRINELEGNGPSAVVEYVLRMSKLLKKSVEFVCQQLPVLDQQNHLVGDVVILHKSWSYRLFLLLHHLRKTEFFTETKMLRQWEGLLFMWDFHSKFYAKRYRENLEELFYQIVSMPAELPQTIAKFLEKGFRGNVLDEGKTLTTTVEETLESKKEQILKNAFHHQFSGKFVYALYKYEQHLNRDKEIAKDSLEFTRSLMKKNRSVEHIFPQGWPWAWINEMDTNNISPEGYAKEKKVDTVINGIGNLMLLSTSENTSVGNKHPKDKLYDGAGGEL